MEHLEPWASTSSFGLTEEAEGLAAADRVAEAKAEDLADLADLTEARAEEEAWEL